MIMFLYGKNSLTYFSLEEVQFRINILSSYIQKINLPIKQPFFSSVSPSNLLKWKYQNVLHSSRRTEKDSRERVMSCDSRNPTIQEYCDFRLRNIPYGSDVKPQSCYDRPVDDAGNARLVLEWGDWLVIGVYFVIVLGAASSERRRLLRQLQQTFFSQADPCGFYLWRFLYTARISEALPSLA